MKKIGAGVVTIFVISCLWLAASPYITVYQMKKAAEERNGKALSGHVDFTALRDNLKNQINSIMGLNNDGSALKDNPLAAFGAVAGSIFTDRLVDLYLTPENITTLMEGKKPNSYKKRGKKLRTEDIKTGEKELEQTEKQKKPFSDTSMSYRGFDSFHVTIKDHEMEKDIEFVLKRQGLFWKLTEINLPF